MAKEVLSPDDPLTMIEFLTRNDYDEDDIVRSALPFGVSPRYFPDLLGDEGHLDVLRRLHGERNKSSELTDDSDRDQLSDVRMGQDVKRLVPRLPAKT